MVGGGIAMFAVVAGGDCLFGGVDEDAAGNIYFIFGVRFIADGIYFCGDRRHWGRPPWEGFMVECIIAAGALVGIAADLAAWSGEGGLRGGWGGVVGKSGRGFPVISRGKR